MVFDIACFVDGNRNDSDNQWSRVANHFQARQLYTFSGAVGKPFRNSILVSKASEIPGPIVLVAPPAPLNAGDRPPLFYPGTVSLAEFIHPEECCYLFGPDQSRLGDALDLDPEYAVFVDYPGDLPMFSWVAAAVVLFDRLAKSG